MSHRLNDTRSSAPFLHVLLVGGAAFALSAATPSGVRAQVPDEVLSACYIPGTGTLYRIGSEGTLPSGCVRPEHIVFQWNQQGIIGDSGPHGLMCWDTDGDGVPDPSEDRNDDSVFDANDCAGPTGADGAQGIQGPDGPAGPTGPAGAGGLPGADGADGAQGIQGPEGPAGPTGPAGADGLPGADGEDGAQGIQGPEGPAGTTGPAGADGEDGAQGPVGPQGPAGADGADGQDGDSGILGYELVNSNTGWVDVVGESQVYEKTMACQAGKAALSVGVIGSGAMNNLISMAITGGGNNQGYFRIRVKAGSNPSEVNAQLLCVTIG